MSTVHWNSKGFCPFLVFTGHTEIPSNVVQKCIFSSLAVESLRYFICFYPSPAAQQDNVVCGNTQKDFCANTFATLEDIHLIWVTHTAEDQY